ncbi:MAG: ParA family protein [Acidobacteriota bacterium]|nr:ParA family protein [Acidobacteriota bacterium]MDH3528132.1 ParA family protein [Acidobacteriota bacterium]
MLKGSKLIWNCEEVDREDESSRSTFIGVFTCKGGVGKTTISAHLAGALALNGYDVSLVDLDPQQNLMKLLGKGVYLPSRTGGTQGSRIDVGNANTWRQGTNRRTRYVVCDCNPEFEMNPAEFLRRFDHCIVPTNLSPLGINKNADVIKRTFDLIRKANTNAELFVLINGLMADEVKRNELLAEGLRKQFESLSMHDPKVHFIDPTEVAIRFSKQLLYWGIHLFDGGVPTLGFRRFGKYSYPRMDFLKLVDYLESREQLRIKTGPAGMVRAVR